MDNAIQDALPFAQDLMQQEDILALAQEVQRKIRLAAKNPDQVLAALTVNYVTTVLNTARDVHDIVAAQGLINLILERAVKAELAVQACTCSKTVH